MKAGEVDPNLTTKLVKERQGILTWIIVGALNWLENGLTVPESILSATVEYFLEEDYFSRFLGRPLPMPYVVEDIARAIWQNGEPVGSIGAWYPKKKIAYVGERGMAWTERHPDPRCEAVRWSICEGAILQAVARTRYVREAAKITILNSTPLPLEVDEVVQFADLLPEELAYKVAPIRTTSWGLSKRLFTKFKDTPKSSFRYQVDDVFQWAIENRAEFAEVRFEGERQWSRVFVAGWQGWDALEQLGMVDQRVPNRSA